MKFGKGTVLILSCLGMEIAWRYAWACFLTLAFIQRRFPLPEALAAFVLAALVTHISRQKKWLFIQAAMVHIAGFLFIAGLITFSVGYVDAPFFSTGWISNLLRRLQEQQQWFILLLIIFCQLLFWLGGHKLMKNPIRYISVCIQFDKGLGALFLLFLILLLVQVKGGIIVEYPGGALMALAFFIFGMLSIGLARNPSDSLKTFRAGYHGIGVILIFTCAIVLCSAALILLFSPQLTHMADTTRTVIKETTAPMGPVVVKIIRYIFSSRRLQREGGATDTENSDVDVNYLPDNGGLEGGFEQVIGWGLIGLMGLAALIVLWGVGKYLMAWLLKKYTADDEKYQVLTWFAEIFLRLIIIPLKAWNGLLQLLKHSDSAVPVYSGILCWGRRSGFPPVPSETPIEYGLKLSHHFPELKEEIEVIIQTFNMEIYGNIEIDERLLSRIRSAQRKMRSPRYWPLRLKGLFVHRPL